MTSSVLQQRSQHMRMLRSRDIVHRHRCLFADDIWPAPFPEIWKLTRTQQEPHSPLKYKGCMGAAFSCRSGRFLVVFCSTGVQGGPGWQLTPSPRRKIIKQLTVIILLALNEVLRFTLHYTLQDCCVHVRPTTRLLPSRGAPKLQYSVVALFGRKRLPCSLLVFNMRQKNFILR